MEISVSTRGFTVKPQIPGITYEKLDLEPKDLEGYIRKGHVLSANFKVDYPITQRQRTLLNFQSIPYLMIDIDDDIECSLDVLLDSIAVVPTIAYSTFSHGIKGNRYRLLYFFDEPITSKEVYKCIYSFICKECNLKLTDNCGKNIVQACIGSRHDCNYIFTNEVLCIGDILNEYREYKELMENIRTSKDNDKSNNFEIKDNKAVNGQIDRIYKNKEEESNIHFCCPVMPSREDLSTHLDKEFLDDYFSNMNYSELLSKYQDKYEYFDRTPLPKVDSTIPIIILPENYVEIKRFRFKESLYNKFGEYIGYKERVVKIRDGQGRRRKIYTSTLLRKVMRPDISFPHLLYCALYDLYHYCYNVSDPIGKKCLYDVVINAARKKPYDALIQRSRLSKKYVANPDYCARYGVSKSQAIGDWKHMQKEKKYEEIGDMYDPTLTYEENHRMMQEFGLNVSIKDIQRFRIKNKLPPLPRKSRGKVKKSEEGRLVSVKTQVKDKMSSLWSDCVLRVRADSGERLRRDAEEVVRCYFAMTA